MPAMGASVDLLVFQPPLIVTAWQREKPIGRV